MSSSAQNLSAASLALLRSLPFFNNFQSPWLEAIASLINISSVGPGEYLLVQGKENSKLFFLLSGQVEVIVDEQPVAILDRRGDLFGEMSVISKQVVTASVRAGSPVEVMWIEAQELAKHSQFQVHEVQHLLYKLYSNILTEKLSTTNQKAKFFERTNKELEKTKAELEDLNKALELKVAERTKDLEQKNVKLETQNAELMVSQRKFEELYRDRDITFQKLEDLHRHHLLPLQFNLEFLQHQATAETQESFRQAIHQVQDLVNLLDPLTSLLSLEKAVKSRRVLCAEPNKKEQIVARLALGGSGVSLDIVGSYDEAKPLLEKNIYDIVFFHPDCKDVALKALEANSIAQLVLLTSANASEVLSTIKALPFVPNIVSRSVDDRLFSIKNISTTVTKLAAHDVFGLQKYLGWGVEVQKRVVRSSKVRAALASEVDQYFGSLGVRKTSRDRVATVLEELLMNAVYDAPTDATGKSLFNHLPRNIAVELTPSQESQLHFASDGMLLAISVTDPFGSLTSDLILKYLESCYSGQQGSLNDGKNKGGAGRGLHQIVENSDLVVFNLRPRVKTEVIALFNIDPKETSVNFSSFHLFVSK